MELFKDLRLIGKRDARPSIRHCDQKGTVEGLHLDIDFAGLGELDCIADEIKEHLADRRSSPWPRGRSGAAVAFRRQFLFGCQGLHSREDCLHDILH